MSSLPWPRFPLEQVAHVQTGIAKGKVLEGPARSIPYLRVANVQDGFVDLHEIKCIDVSADLVSRYALQRDDVLFTEGGDADKLGRGCVWRGQIDPCLHQNHVFAVRADRARIIPKFLAYYAASPAGRTYFLTCAKQTTNLASINSTQLKALPVPTPPIREQQKIVAVLSAVDEAIDATKAVIAQLQVVKKAMMAELLTRGIPGRHTRFKKTAVGEIPAQWNVTSLEHSGTWLSGGTPNKSDASLWDGDVPWVSPKDMKVSLISDAEDHVSKFAIGNGTRVVEPGTILVVVRGMILAHSFPVALTTAPVSFNQDIKALVPNGSFVPEYLLFWLQFQRENILNIVDAATHGTKRVPTESLFALPVCVPPLDEQAKIVSILRSVDDSQRASTAELKQRSEVKSALLSALLSGEVRVTPDP